MPLHHLSSLSLGRISKPPKPIYNTKYYIRYNYFGAYCETVGTYMGTIMNMYIFAIPQENENQFTVAFVFPKNMGKINYDDEINSDSVKCNPLRLLYLQIYISKQHNHFIKNITECSYSVNVPYYEMEMDFM